VAGDLGLGRVLAEGGEEELGEADHPCESRRAGHFGCVTGLPREMATTQTRNRRTRG
jgi:hypothetical protein